MSRPISEETRTAIIAAHRKGGRTNKQIAEELGVSVPTVVRTLKLYRENGITMEEATEKHQAVMEQKHAARSPWMEHITPLHKHKQELETAIAQKQEELDKAKQEYRNFLATVRQLMEEQK